jgi:hypothetical protein
MVLYVCLLNPIDIRQKRQYGWKLHFHHLTPAESKHRNCYVGIAMLMACPGNWFFRPRWQPDRFEYTIAVW